MAFAPFDLVQRYAQLRDTVTGGLAPLQTPDPPPQLQVPDDHDGHDHNDGWAPSPNGKSGLVSWAYKGPTKNVDASVLPYFEQLVQQIPGLSFRSGHRTPEANRAANGVPNSWHLQGRAGDFVGSAADMQRGAAWAKANGAREVLVHNAGSGLHLHVAW